MIKTKEYVFFKQTAGDKSPTRIVKTEKELTDKDKQLLLGNLMHMWDNTPSDVRAEFITNVTFFTANKSRWIVDNS